MHDRVLIGHDVFDSVDGIFCSGDNKRIFGTVVLQDGFDNSVAWHRCGKKRGSGGWHRSTTNGVDVDFGCREQQSDVLATVLRGGAVERREALL